ARDERGADDFTGTRRKEVVAQIACSRSPEGGKGRNRTLSTQQNAPAQPSDKVRGGDNEEGKQQQLDSRLAESICHGGPVYSPEGEHEQNRRQYERDQQRDE